MMQSPPQYKQHKLKSQNLSSITLYFLVYFSHLAVAPWAGYPFNFNLQSTLNVSKASDKKIKILPLLHYFLVYFWACCFFFLGWRSCLFHGVKHLSMRAIQATKNQNLSSISIFSCLFITFCCCTQD